MGPGASTELVLHQPLAAGETRTLTIDLGRAGGVQALDLELRYDPSALAIVDVARADLTLDFTLATHTDGGSLRVVLYGVRSLEESGTILVVTVRALENTEGPPVLQLHGVANEGRIPLVTRSAPAREDSGRFAK